MATLYRTDGTTEPVEPKNGKDFKLNELYKILGVDMIEVVPMPTGELMVVDEEGKYKPRVIVNKKATGLFGKKGLFAGDFIAGNALVIAENQMT